MAEKNADVERPDQGASCAEIACQPSDTLHSLVRRRCSFNRCGRWGAIYGWEFCPFEYNPEGAKMYCTLYTTRHGKPRRLREVNVNGDSPRCEQCKRDEVPPNDLSEGSNEG